MLSATFWLRFRATTLGNAWEMSYFGGSCKAGRAVRKLHAVLPIAIAAMALATHPGPKRSSTIWVERDDKDDAKHDNLIEKTLEI